MNRDLAFKIVALVECAAMLPWAKSYLHLYTVIQNVGPNFTVAAMILVFNTLFLSSPLLSVYGAFKNKKWCWWVLCAFPVIAFDYGILAIPYASHVAPIGLARTVALAVINGGLIAYVVTLKFKVKASAVKAKPKNA